MIKNSFWAKFDRPNCYPDNCNCEPYVDGWVIQPSATITSLPIILLGFWIFLSAKNSKFTYPKIFGVLSIILGIASTLAHGTFTDYALHFDFYAILLSISWVGTHCYFKNNDWTKRQILIWIFVSLIMFATVYLYQSWRIYLCLLYFAFTFVLWLKWIKLHKERLSNFVLSFVVLTISSILFYVDENKIWCAENIWILGHSLWHLGVCLSLYLAYKGFYRE